MDWRRRSSLCCAWGGSAGRLMTYHSINSSLTCLNLCGHDLFTSNLAPGDVWKIPTELELGIGQSRKVRSGAKLFFANPKTPGGALNCILYPAYEWPIKSGKCWKHLKTLYPNRILSFSLENLFLLLLNATDPPQTLGLHWTTSPWAAQTSRGWRLRASKWLDWIRVVTGILESFAVQEILYLLVFFVSPTRLEMAFIDWRWGFSRFILGLQYLNFFMILFHHVSLCVCVLQISVSVTVQQVQSSFSTQPKAHQRLSYWKIPVTSSPVAGGGGVYFHMECYI